MAKVNLYDADGRVISTVDGLAVERSQLIDLDYVREERTNKAGLKAQDYDHVASVPTLIWELWIREGRDPLHASAKQIVQWLREGDMDYFIATDKRQ